MLRNCLEISLDSLEHNINHISNKVSPCEVLAVLKSDAYGLGAYAIAQKIYDLGYCHFGVSSLSEALELKFLSRANIHLLGVFLQEELESLVANDIILPINSLEQAHKIDKIAKKQNKKARVQFLVDTAMGRLGFIYSQAEQVIRQSLKLAHLEVIGIYSHFPYAYEDSKLSLRQISDFKKLLEKFVCLKNGFIHIANSDALNNPSLKESYFPPFNMVRVGINLFGCYDLRGNHHKMDLKVIFKLKSRIIHIKRMAKGMSVGYGCSYILKRDSRIGVVCIGYSDGVALALGSYKSFFKVSGKKVPIIGAISMDYTTVDLTDVKSAMIGDEIVCLDDELNVHTWADRKKTLTYDIICSFGKRVERVYL